MKRWVAAAAMGLGLATTSQAVAGQDATMNQPDAVYGEAFSVVQTVRELPDGRVLVADPLGQALVVVDFSAGRADTLGRVGGGPREYRQPDAVWPLPDGKTLLVDLGNGRLTELSADLEFGDTRPYTIGEIGPGRDLVLAIPQGVDGQGNLYFRSFGMMSPGGERPDSSWVLRFNPATEAVDSIAQFGLAATTRRVSGGANNQNVQLVPIPLSPADAWGVAPDGRVAIARAPSYKVEWVQPDGSLRSGSEIDFDAISIRQAEKEEWQTAQVETGGGMRLAVSMTNGSMSMSASRGGASEDDDLDQYDWPDVKPPFYQGRLPVDQMGRAWVRRHVRAGTAPTYDIVGADGARVASVALDVGRRVVGFGDGTVYVVHTDQFGLQTLERHAMPRS